MRADGSNGVCRASIACPFRDGAALKCSNDNGTNTVDSQDCWMWALVWSRPIKRLSFSSREECIVSHLRTVDQQQSGASLQRLWSSCCCQWESLPLFHAPWPLSQWADPDLTSSHCSSLEVNELQRLIYPVCSAGDLCVEKDFGASIPEIKS